MVGWSGGGAMTARALCDYGTLFKVGVAASGNHDSSLYAALWSDKYCGPSSGGQYADVANSAAASKLTGKLLLICGDMDENVHMSETLSLVDAFIHHNRDFDLLIVPNAGHDVLLTNGYAQRRMWDYFVIHLLGEAPPPHFDLSFDVSELTRWASVLSRQSRQ